MSAPKQKTSRRKQVIYLTVDLCPKHGFGSLALMAIDANGIGSGKRVMGPKSCCPLHKEIVRWRMTSESVRDFAAELVGEVDAMEREEADAMNESTSEVKS